MALRTNTITRHFPSSTTNNNAAFLAVFNEISASFSDLTTAANNNSFNDVTMPSVVGDRQYYGGDRKFESIRFRMFGVPSGITRTWAYWNGSSWAALTVAAPTIGNTHLTAAESKVTWTPPSDWASTTVNGVAGYYIRSEVATASFASAGTGWIFNPGYIHDFGGSMTVQLPETTSRTIRNVSIILRWKTPAEGGFPGIVRISAKLTGGSVSYVLDEAGFDYQANYNNNTAGTTWETVADATSYFASNFSGASSVLELTASVAYTPMSTSTNSSLNVTNMSAVVAITYEYDDSSLTTATKTVFIPIESSNGVLSTTLAEIGTNQVPALDTFCPEASKTFDEICFVLFGLHAVNGSGTSNLYFALDGGAEVAMGTVGTTHANNSGMHDVYHWLPSVTTNSTHALQARTSVSANSAPFLGGYIAVTYRYNASTSTTILNSLMLPMSGEGGTIYPLNTSGDAGSTYVDVWVEEPATIALVQSAVVMYFANNYGTSLGWYTRVGSQSSFRSWTGSISTTTKGPFSWVERFDSGAAGGSGHTLVRGKNRIAWEYYWSSTTPNTFNQISAFMILNYTSGKAAAGVGAHNHTTLWKVKTAPVAASQGGNYEISAIAPNIPESQYYTNHVGYRYSLCSASDDRVRNVKTERLSGEGSAKGWVDLMTQYAQMNSNTVWIGQGIHMIDASKHFRRGTWDADDERLVLESARKYVCNGDRSFFNDCWFLPFMLMYVTYHSVSFGWSGTVTDASAAAQSGATVTLHRNDTGQIVGTATTDGSGAYNITWFDDTVQVHSQVRISGSLVGRSDDGYAS